MSSGAQASKSVTEKRAQHIDGATSRSDGLPAVEEGKSATDGKPGEGRVEKTFGERLSELFSIPPWITNAAKSRRAWKTLTRCWLASWCAFLLLLPHRSLLALGNAAFFGLIASFIMPPNLPIQMFLFGMLTLVVGMCMGWAIGAAAMKAALAARSQTLLASAVQRAQEGAAGAANPDAVFQLDVFQGFFLDWRSSLVYAVFLGFAAFIFGLVRAYVPKLTLLSVFGTIVVDVFCTFGPLLPTASYTIVSSFLISTGCYAAIAIVCIVFVFPETLNHAYLEDMIGLLGQVRGFMVLQGEVLDKTPEEIADDDEGAKGLTGGIIGRSKAMRAGILGGLQALQPKSGLIDAEFSWGRWSGHDCKTLEQPLSSLIAKISGFHSFTKLVDSYVSPPSLSVSPSSVSSTAASASPSSVDLNRSAEHPASDSALIRQLISSSRTAERENQVTLDDLLPLLRDSTRTLRDAYVRALDAAAGIIEEVNRGRWSRDKGAKIKLREEEMDKSMEALRNALKNYRADGRLAICEPFMPILEAYSDQEPSRSASFLSPGQNYAGTPGHFQAHHRPRPPLRALVVACVFASHLLVSADATLAFCTVVRGLTEKRKKARLWAPGGLRAVANWVFRRERGTEDGLGGAVEGVNGVGGVGPLERAAGEDIRPTNDKEGEGSYRRDPDSRPPTNTFQRIMDSLHRLYKWSRTAEAVYVWKYVIVTIALWIPSVIVESAHFYYVEKGLWALIMAQTTMNIYISDQIYNYAARLIGTFIGLVGGLLAWYIGNGRGTGSPYGSAAVFAVVLVPIVFARINAPPTSLVPILMLGVTLSLIMGYSWIDGHLVTIGNPGIGWSIAWKRWVLVTIGCGASFVMMMIPPTSGRKAVRLRNATIISELSSLYGLLMSAWITDEEEGVKNGSDPRSDDTSDTASDEEKAAGAQPPAQMAQWSEEFRARIIPLAQAVQALKGQTAIARWEGNIRGKWPVEEYSNLVEREGDMLAALAQLSGALAHLDPAWRNSLNRGTLILNPNFITDVMSIFALVSQSLRTSEPMHQILPSSLLDRLLYHQRHTELMKADTLDEGVERPHIDLAGRVRSPEFMYYATGVAAVSQTIWCLDDMHQITKRLCGEIPFRGFNEWKKEYERVYEPIG